jgi:hypothetical protein
MAGERDGHKRGKDGNPTKLRNSVPAPPIRARVHDPAEPVVYTYRRQRQR